jgi:hypothetical protein
MPAASPQTQDPFPWPEPRPMQGVDTVAGLAHRFGLPVATILQWRERTLPAGLPGPAGAELRMDGIQPWQSRLTGPA